MKNNKYLTGVVKGGKLSSKAKAAELFLIFIIAAVLIVLFASASYAFEHLDLRTVASSTPEAIPMGNEHLNSLVANSRALGYLEGCRLNSPKMDCNKLTNAYLKQITVKK